MKKRKQMSLSLDQALYDLIADLAREQQRKPANFIEQFLSVSLDESVDRVALIDKMNPSMTMIKTAIENERRRLEGSRSQ